MAAPSASVIRSLPKCDLHSHIDGSIPLGELFRIARRHRRTITTQSGTEIDSVSAFARHVKGPGYDSMLENIVERFYPITNLMQTPEILRDVGRSYVAGLKRDNIAYAEGRFAPQYHTKESLPLEEVIESMAEGLAEGCERYGVKVKLIVAIGRESKPEFGQKVAKVAAGSRSVVALDLGGPEAGNPPEKFRGAFKLAADGGLKVTVHAGEGAGSVEQNLKNIRTAISDIGAQRVGHAIDLAKDESLVSLAMERSVTIEMNPVSNMVLGKIRGPSDLAIDRLLKEGVCVTVNSDDPALWPRGCVSDVLISVCRAYRFGLDALDILVTNSIMGAFAGENEKAALLEEYHAVRKKLS
ncbi:MAG: adenosine deaminase [Nitrososphaerales archaeon]|nr:adenosine deaminase [Nitrososphaerales archaeon]